LGWCDGQSHDATRRAALEDPDRPWMRMQAEIDGTAFNQADEHSEYIHHPGLDHDPLMQKTTPEQLVWVRDRLAGKPWTGNCDTLAYHRSPERN
jgi:hypothetical protein